MFDYKFFCRITVTTEKGKVQVGTGCAVSKDRILTASHVVEKAEKIKLEFGEQNTLIRSEDAVVVWDGMVHKCIEQKVDVAVISCVIPEGHRPDTVRFAEGKVDRCDYQSCGFGKLVEKDTENGMFAFHGSMPPITEIVSQALAGSYDGPTPEFSQVQDTWAGVSGSCLFEQAGQKRLLAITTRYLPKRPNIDQSNPMIEAIRLPFLMKDAGFREAVGRTLRTVEQILDDARLKLWEIGVEVLKKNQEACSFVANCHLTKDDPKEIASLIYNSEQPLEILNQCASPRFNDEIAELRTRIGGSIWRLTELAAPLSFSPDYLVSLEYHLFGDDTHASGKEINPDAAAAHAACVMGISAKVRGEAIDVSTDFDVVGQIPELPERGGTNSSQYIKLLCDALVGPTDALSADPIDIKAAMKVRKINKVYWVVVFRSKYDNSIFDAINKAFPDLILIYAEGGGLNEKDQYALSLMKAIKDKFYLDENATNNP